MSLPCRIRLSIAAIAALATALTAIAALPGTAIAQQAGGASTAPAAPDPIRTYVERQLQGGTGRVTVTVGAQHGAGGIRPQPGDAAQQRGPSAARRPGDHQRFARTESQVEVAQQNLAIGVANLDVAQLN